MSADRVSMLQASGVDSERPRSLGFAVWSDDLPLVRELLAEGVDPNAYGIVCSGVSPLMESVNELEAFYDADRVEVTRLLLQAGADVGLQDDEGRFALHYAAGAGEVAIELLLRAGGDVAAADKHGDTPLHLAVDRGCVSAIEALRRGGADPGARNADGHTPRGLFDGNRSEFHPDEVARVNRAFG